MLRGIVVATGILILGVSPIIGVVYAKIPSTRLTESGSKFELPVEIKDQSENKIEIMKSRPEIRIKRWNNEVNFGLRYDGVSGIGHRPLFTNRIEWKGIDEEVHAYPIDDSRFEFEVVLDKKPKSNVFRFTIDGHEELKFLYQPPLTQEEINNGANRPENVIGSFAVYHKTKKGNVVGANNYGTGKAFHIYRPKAFDANGDETWAMLSIDKGVLIVTVPQEFLDNANYPVTVDPTLGLSTQGASTQGIASQFEDRSTRVGSAATSTSDGTVSSITGWVHTTSGTSTVDIFLGLNQKDSVATGQHGELDTVVLNAQELTTTAVEVSGAITASINNGTVYVLNVMGDGSDLTAFQIETYFDTDTEYARYVDTHSGATSFSDGQDNPWVVSQGVDRVYSVYVTYGSVVTNKGKTMLMGMGF